MTASQTRLLGRKHHAIVSASPHSSRRVVRTGKAWGWSRAREVEALYWIKTRADTLCLQGYDADHSDIDLLRLRNYTIGRKLTQEELISNGLNRVSELFASMQPFVSLVTVIWCIPSFGSSLDLAYHEIRNSKHACRMAASNTTSRLSCQYAPIRVMITLGPLKLILDMLSWTRSRLTAWSLTSAR